MLLLNNDGSKVVHNIKYLWVIIWYIFTSTNNTTTILFPTQLWELLYTYHVIKQCTEKETTSLSILKCYIFDEKRAITPR
jgi:hypothetical protein